MKILITGGQGFIAKSLSEVLMNEHRVFAYGREELDLLNTDVVYTVLKKNKFDVIIHAATYDAAPTCSTKDPSKVLENNLKMFFNLARCQNDFGRMIYFGSGAEFSREHWVPRMKESYFDRYVPQDQYGFSKYIMTKYTLESQKLYNLRVFGLFGKYDDWRYRFIPNACCRAVLNLPITIYQNRVFDYMYIDDFVEVVKWFLTHQPKHRVYNVCTGRGYKLKSLAEMVAKISDKNLKITIQREGFGKEYTGDNSLLISELKNFQFCAMKNAIKDLYQWYEMNKELINKERLL